MRRLGIAIVLGLALLAVPAAGAAEPLPVLPAFQLEGTNGYTISVSPESSGKGAVGAIKIVAARKYESVRYLVPATLTETSIRASMGELGEISVEFQRSNEAASISCGGHPFAFDSGSWVGTIAFHGEEGYTEAEATSVPSSFETLLSGGCGGVRFGSATFHKPRGAALDVRNPGLGPELFVDKPRPGAPAAIAATLREYENGIAIGRTIERRIPGKDFSFDAKLRGATVRPPAPFAGSATFDLGAKPGRRWSGDLTADFPGRAGVALTGPLLRATLVPSDE